MKIIRLGMTESGLLFLSWVITRKFNELNPDIRKLISRNIFSLMNWLYTTSGYYDKNVVGNKFNFNYDAFNSNFYKYIDHLRTSVNDCDETQLYFHDGLIRSLYERYKEDYHTQYNIKNPVVLNGIPFLHRLPSIYKQLEHKRVCVVSSFSGIIQHQYESGNIYRLGFETQPNTRHLKFPHIASLSTYQFPYCFLNNGPHQDYFETIEKVFEELKEHSTKYPFDIVLLGCGAYGHMLTHRIHTELNKDAIYVGGTITNVFGILSSRELHHNKKDYPINEYWITSIPDEYKPPNYKDIEDGCYW
jgi:hypothetical protein